MVTNITGKTLDVPALPDGYQWCAWHPQYRDIHAEVKYRSFEDEIDALVFPSLSTRSGCQRLMIDICSRNGFLPETTWLIGHHKTMGFVGNHFCATIQGVVNPNGWGAIQNVGVVPEHRDHGLGKSLVMQCLNGFQQVGVNEIFLEVTSDNFRAIQLYEKLGFVKQKLIYRAESLKRV
jgi:hypothetical protein